jgi:hypothetical protein
VPGEREQAISTAGERDGESNGKRGKSEWLVNRVCVRKALAAEQGEEHATQREEEKRRAVVVADEVGERNGWRDWNQVRKRKNYGEEKKESSCDGAARAQRWKVSGHAGPWTCYFVHTVCSHEMRGLMPSQLGGIRYRELAVTIWHSSVLLIHFGVEAEC